MLLALINLPNIIKHVEDTSDGVLVICCFLLYPVLHLLITLFPLSSEVETQKPAAGAIPRQVRPENGCGQMQL